MVVIDQASDPVGQIIIERVLYCFLRPETKSENCQLTEMVSNPLIPRVKPWMIQSFLTFDSMDGLLKCDHSLENF